MSDMVNAGAPQRLLLCCFGLPFAAIGGGIMYASLFVFGGVASFFALFGLPFFGMGMFMLYSGVTGQMPSSSDTTHMRLRNAMVAHRRSKAMVEGGGLSLDCTTCGATVSDQSVISPSGDVKCTHCSAWFNVRR